MVIRGELVLVIVAIALALIAIAQFLSGRLARWRTPIAAAGCSMAGLAPALLFPFVVPAGAEGTALWEWSAVGGPTIQASYRLDGLAAVGLAIGALYGGAALIAATRVPSRSSLLRPAVLVLTFILMTLCVTNDLVAVIVVLGALAAATIFVALLVSPAPAVARVTAYVAAGVQAFVVAGLLVTRFGGASFRFEQIAPGSVTPGVVLAATIGAALFAGLYPFVPWGYRHEDTSERESLRGLLTMPAGVCATIALLRIVGATRIDLSTLMLPGSVPEQISFFAVLFFLWSGVRVLQRRPLARRRLVIAALVLGFVGLYPILHWSHVVLVACLFTVAYAAAVSLALPDQWPITRYDVALAAAWAGIAAGTPTAVAGGLAVLLGGAFAALADAFWMPPHRAYIAMLASTTTIIAGALAVVVGAVDAPDPVTIVLAIVVIAAVVVLELLHVGRRLEAAAAPSDLETTATVFAFLSAMLAALVFAGPLLDALARAFGRAPQHDVATMAYSAAVLVVVAAVLAVVAGAVRPMLPPTTPLARSLEQMVSLADPVPFAATSFRTLERSASVATSLFALFEQRAGVWLAVTLIAGVLVWVVR